MNNTFNFNRLCKVMLRDASMYLQKTGWYLLVIALIPSILYIFGFTDPEIGFDARTRVQIIDILCLFACLVVPAHLYRDINDPKKGITYALIPTSTLEKFISMVIFCMIVTPIVFWAGSIIIDTILVWLPESSFKGYIWQEIGIDAKLEYFKNKSVSNPDNLTTYDVVCIPSEFEVFIMPVITLTTSISIFMFGNMLFKKHKTTKTLGIIVLFNILVTIIGVIIMARTEHIWDPFISSLEDEELEIYILNCVRKFLNFYYINIPLCIGLLGATYYKMKTQKY